MIKGNARRMKELANELSKNRGIKNLKFHFMDII
jgi:metal-responsive CopG/Arc/MetJ family transcriptional regulator